MKEILRKKKKKLAVMIDMLSSKNALRTFQDHLKSFITESNTTSFCSLTKITSNALFEEAEIIA